MPFDFDGQSPSDSIDQQMEANEPAQQDLSRGLWDDMKEQSIGQPANSRFEELSGQLEFNTAALYKLENNGVCAQDSKDENELQNLQMIDTLTTMRMQGEIMRMQTDTTLGDKDKVTTFDERSRDFTEFERG